MMISSSSSSSTPTRSWFQQLWSIPLNIGLEGMNYAIMNTITLIFNQYGKRLLKIDTDQIIASNECVGEFDVFHLHPLLFKESEQRLGPNVFHISSNTITGLSISVPWRNIFTKTTLVSIEEINIDLTSVNRADTIYYSLIEQELQTLFYDNKKPEQNSDLLSTFREIKHLLQQYFNHVQFQIKTVTIKLDNYFVLTIEDVEHTTIPEHHKSVLHINTVTVTNLTNDKLVKINNVLITKPIRSSEPSDNGTTIVSIQTFTIQPELVDCLPVLFYNPNTENTDRYKIHIETFSLDRLTVSDLELDIELDTVTVTKIRSISMDQLMRCEAPGTSNKVLSVLLKQNTVTMHTNIDIHLSSLRRTRAHLENLMNFFQKFSQKLVHIGTKPDRSDSSQILQNLSCTLIILPNHENIRISCDKIIIDIEDSGATHVVSLVDTKIYRNSETAIIEQIIVNTTTSSLTLFKLEIHKPFDTSSVTRSESFSLLSDKTGISYDVDKSQFEIHFSGAISHNVVALYQYIYDMVDKFRSKRVVTKDESKQTEIIIRVSDSTIILEYYDAKFSLEIKQGVYNITHGIVTDLDLDVVMDSYLLFELNTELIDLTSNLILIRSAQILIDTDAIIRIQNFADHIVVHTDRESNKNMLQSISVQSVHELELMLEEKIPKRDLNFRILKTNVYIFEKLPIHGTRSNLPEPAIGISVTNANLTRDSNRILCVYNLTVESYIVSDRENSNTSWEKVIIAVPIPKKNEIVPILHVELRSHKHDAAFKTQSYSIHMKLDKHILNIREESIQRFFQTLLELYPGSTDDAKDVVNKNSIMFRDVTIDSVQLTVNICPMALNNLTGYDLICIHNYKIKLSKIRISGLFAHSQVLSIISEVWDKDVDPTNIKQFLPNLQIMYLSNFFSTIKKYINKARNKHRVKIVTKVIDHGIGIVLNWIYYGFMKLWSSPS